MSQESARFEARDLRERLERFSRPGVPKYVAMRDAIVSAVTDGRWPAGTRLPTESEWVAGLPLSLGTVQRSLRLLVDDGLVVRRHGQGTFIAERGVGRMHAPLHCRFFDDSGTAYLPVFAKVVKRHRVESSGRWSRHLGDNPLVCVERVLTIGEEFKVFSRFYVDPTRLPAFAALPLRKLSGENFKEIIWRESHQPIGRIEQFMSSSIVPPEISVAIDVPRRTVGQLLEVAAYSGRSSPLYYQELFIPPNNRRLHLAGDGKDLGIGD